ncbi:hypothetical protein PITCH_A1970009 [uncultured Desulfobacterium sp.]|uniref:Uncharacterized protein n=1 Tax=uncultured Desulfobacterium sp. TaxID=201089 RepID=A0A445MWD5_9BACT|nr:hypothetical protein PITCH_A1970009 [uncultured Desulfobacterium sp.]
MKNVDVEADVMLVDEVYEAGKGDAEMMIQNMRAEMDAVREESEAIGAIKALDCNGAFNKLHRYAVLYQIKQKKEYKKGGMTWDEFCEAIGEPKRTVDLILKEIAPVVEEFSASFANSIGLPFNKIRYLGRAVAGELASFAKNALLIDGQEIELTPENKEEIEAAIDAMKETHLKEVKSLKADVKRYKNNVDKQVAEETKAQRKEISALVEKVERLEKFAPDDKDPETWMIDQMEVIREAAAEFSVACRHVIMDERIMGNTPVIGQVEGLMQAAELSLRMLRETWNERFLTDYED